MKLLEKLKYKRFIILGFIGAILVLTKLLSTQAQMPQASQFISGPNDLSSTNTGIYKLMLNSGSDAVGFASSELSFDKNLLSLVSIGVTGPLQNQIIVSSVADANNSGTITLVLGLSPSDVDNPPSGEFEQVTLEFNKIGTPSGSTSLTFNPQSLSVVNMEAQQLTVGSENFAISFDAPTQTPTNYPTLTSSPSLTPTESPTPTFTPTPTITPTATLTPTSAPSNTPTPTSTFTPTPTPTPSQAENQPASLSIFPIGEFKTGKESSLELSLSIESSVVGVDAVILYDPAFVEIVNVTSSNLFNGNFTYVDDKNGLLRISASQTPQQSISVGGIVATITTKPKKEGQTELNFDFVSGSKSESNVISIDGQDVLEETNGAILNILNVEIFAHLSLITESENALVGHVATGSVNLIDNSWEQEFVTDNEGKSQTWQLDNTFLTPNLTFALKTQGYLRKNTTQTLLEGTNVLNFGFLFAGDLNDDGIVNNIDVAIMYQNWFGTGNSDYNKDGIVNTYDFWILVNNFFKEDE